MNDDRKCLARDVAGETTVTTRADIVTFLRSLMRGLERSAKKPLTAVFIDERYRDLEIDAMVDYIVTVVLGVYPESERASILVLTTVYWGRFHRIQRCSTREFRLLWLTALLVALKYEEDDAISNRSYARCLQMSTTRLNTMEVEFVFVIHFRLFINISLYESCIRYIINNRPQEFLKLHGRN
jgi:hypothetical protein